MNSLKNLFKIIYFQLLSFFPAVKKNQIFTPLLNRKNDAGPLRFLNNLQKGLKNEKWNLVRSALSSSKVALIMSNSPGNYFHRICNANDIYTVLRVDGFYLPTIFDNKIHNYRDLRILDKRKIDINQRLQMDLLMSNWVVYQSYFSKNISDSYLYNRIDNFSIIPNSVNENVFVPSHKKNKKPILLMLGTWRDIDLFKCSLCTFLIVRQQIDCKIRIIGSVTKEIESELSNWMEKNNLDNTIVEIFGKLSFLDLPKAIGSSDVNIHIKAGDSCPNAVLESMACGIPVICNDWGGTKELVGDAGIVIKGSKFLYDNQLAKNTADAILSVLNNIDHFSFLARERVEKYFSIDRMVKDYMKILNRDYDDNK